MSDLRDTIPGGLPEDWAVSPLGDITSKIQDGTHFSPQSTTGPCRYITSKNIRFGKMNIANCDWISQEEHDAIYKRCDVRKGDVLLTKDGANTGNAALNSLDEPFSLLSSVALIRTDDVDAHSPFILQYLLSPYGQQRMKDLMAGNAITRLTLEKINAFVVPQPPVCQQRKIARILTTVDDLIEQTEALIEKYKSIKQGMMHDLFTRGVDSTGQLRPPYADAPHLYRESKLGWIPKDWEVELLDDVASRGSGHTPNREIPAYWNGGVKWVSLADSNKLDRLFISSTEYEISDLGLANSSAVRHPPDTVILSRDAGIGKSAITTEVMAVSQHFMAWRCGDRFNHFLLYYWMQYEKPRFEAIAMGSTIKTIGLPFFRKLKIAVPERHEQDRAANSLLAMDKRLFGLEEELHKYRTMKTGLMQDLLTGKVRVNVDEAEEVIAR